MMFPYEKPSPRVTIRVADLHGIIREKLRGLMKFHAGEFAFIPKEHTEEVAKAIVTRVRRWKAR